MLMYSLSHSPVWVSLHICTFLYFLIARFNSSIIMLLKDEIEKLYSSKKKFQYFLDVKDLKVKVNWKATMKLDGSYLRPVYVTLAVFENISGSKTLAKGGRYHTGRYHTILTHDVPIEEKQESQSAESLFKK